MQALIEENINQVDPEETTTEVKAKNSKNFDFEYRLKLELKEANLIDSNYFYFNESDEVCTELRILQRQLKHQAAINNKRKQQLKRKIETELPNQEFYVLLDQVEHLIEVAYKKFLAKKKRKSDPTYTELVELINKRTFLIKSFENIVHDRITRMNNLLEFEDLPDIKLPFRVESNNDFFLE